jgi:hypothetical protein
MRAKLARDAAQVLLFSIIHAPAPFIWKYNIVLCLDTACRPKRCDKRRFVSRSHSSVSLRGLSRRWAYAFSLIP